jgi:hypothetical protein
MSRNRFGGCCPDRGSIDDDFPERTREFWLRTVNSFLIMHTFSAPSSLAGQHPSWGERQCFQLAQLARAAQAILRADWPLGSWPSTTPTASHNQNPCRKFKQSNRYHGVDVDQ